MWRPRYFRPFSRECFRVICNSRPNISSRSCHWALWAALHHASVAETHACMFILTRMHANSYTETVTCMRGLVPTYKYIHKQTKHFIHSEEIIFGCCVTPWWSKMICWPLLVPKIPFCKNPKKNSSGTTWPTSHVCVSFSVLVSMCVCVEERRCGVKTLKSPKKTHFPPCKKSFSLSLTNKLSLHLLLSQS